ncbi:MAG: hypothetical protein EPN85_00815, partial [Bacteroidetes bacterium]
MKKNSFIFTLLVSTYWLLAGSCSNDEGVKKPEPSNKKPETVIPPTPVFNQDSAYAFIKDQINFGPRVPGTPAHAKCAEYLSSKLKSYGWEVQIQNANITTFDKKKFTLKNVIGSYKPEITNR